VGGVENWVLTYSVEEEYLEMAESLVDFIFKYIENCPHGDDARANRGR